MELFLFLAGVVVVGVVLLVRSRGGGSGSRSVGPPEHLEGGPVGYGASVAPPGTSRAADVNAPWFGRDHSGDAGGRTGSAAE